MTVSHTYDAGGRETVLAYRKTYGEAVAVYTSVYDALGNRVVVDELGGSFAYAYDASRQLIAEHRTGTSGYSCTFSYDGVGNRLTSTAQDGAVTSYLYNPAHALLTTQALGAAPTSFSYDAAGNTVREVEPSADVTYTWNGEHRLTQVSSAGSMETYTYDASGLRRRKQAGGATTNYVWDRVNLLSELDGNLARIAQYTDFAGVWGGLTSQRRNGTSRHFVQDLSANTRALLDDAAVTDRCLYRSFGVEEATSGCTTNVLRFGGQVGYYRDLADRLYVRARHYGAALHRWLSSDPLRSPIRLTRYAYASNRAIPAVDPTGLQESPPETILYVGFTDLSSVLGGIFASALKGFLGHAPMHMFVRWEGCKPGSPKRYDDRYDGGPENGFVEVVRQWNYWRAGGFSGCPGTFPGKLVRRSMASGFKRMDSEGISSRPISPTEVERRILRIIELIEKGKGRPPDVYTAGYDYQLLPVKMKGRGWNSHSIAKAILETGIGWRPETFPVSTNFDLQRYLHRAPDYWHGERFGFE